jgi:hypothetical protein
MHECECRTFEIVANLLLSLYSANRGVLAAELPSVFPWSRVCGLMVQDDSQAAATKQDIQMLMDSMGKLYEANERWKEEIIHEFKVVAEDIRHDALGANKDKIQNHENRITHVEQALGVI